MPPQNTPANTDIASTLAIAADTNATVLKKACFETIFNFGQHFIADPAFDDLPRELAIEMLRHFAACREDHMPSLKEKVPPALPRALPAPVVPPAAPPQAPPEAPPPKKKQAAEGRLPRNTAKRNRDDA
jgi:hypothetical protein